jgi:MYXO-CTERM domain-containing protein
LAVASPAASAAPASVDLGNVIYVGTLEIEIGGTLSGSGYDQLNHVIGGGMAFLGGTLQVTLWGGFMPAAGDEFEFLTAVGGVNGVFAAVSYPALSPGLEWQLAYEPYVVTLNVVAPPSYTADFDEDGDVDSDDLADWQSGFGEGAQHDDGDADADSDADGLDFLTWQQQAGSGISADASLQAIPEPGPAPLWLMALAASGVWCRRRAAWPMRSASRGAATCC